jgi:uracil-DNA glycosylase family 4
LVDFPDWAAGLLGVGALENRMPTAFDRQDNAYLDWIEGHQHGHVVNTYRRPHPGYLMLHLARCGTGSGTLARHWCWPVWFNVSVCDKREARCLRPGFGNSLTVSPIQRTTSVDQQTELDTVQQNIAACTLCVDSGYIPISHPIFYGHAGHRLMIIGQAPGPSAGERPLPYTGATGKTLQGWLERAGFPPGSLHRDFYLTSLTKCFPGPATSGGKGDRPPSAAEIALCARHLEREIALVRPKIVVSLGRLAAERLDPSVRKLPLADLVGSARPAERADHAFLLIPLPHPSGVSRWLNDPAHRARLDEALAVLRREAEGGRRETGGRRSEVGGRRSDEQ